MRLLRGAFLALTLSSCLYHYKTAELEEAHKALERYQRRDTPLMAHITRPDGSVASGELVQLTNTEAVIDVLGAPPETVPITPDTELRVYKIDEGRVILLALLTGIPLVVGGVALALSGVSMSCPLVEVPGPDGQVYLVGELGGGTLFPALASADRLALPPVQPGPFSWAVVRDPAETDHFDTLHLDLVEVPVGRALATPTHDLVLVGDLVPLGSVRAAVAPDAAGRADPPDLRDVTADVAYADQRAAFVEPVDQPGWDVLTAELPHADKPSALLVRLAGTPLPERALQRLWTAMGPEHQRRMADWGTLPDHAAEARAWRHDAGMDLRVEVRTPVGWDTLAWIPSPGWIGARDVPVDGEDLLAALASADGRRADLTPGRERIDVTFDLPDLGVPVAAFAAADVHYVPLHTPGDQAEPGLARWMRGHPERFPALVAAEASAIRAVAQAE